MTELRFPEEFSLEDAEVQRTQQYAALKAADQRYVPSLQQEDGLGDSGRSIWLRSQYSTGPSQIVRTRSAVRGPVTDGRGLGSLAPFVLPGILRRASMASGLEPQTSTFQVFSSQSLSDNQQSSESSARGRPRASTAPRQRPPGIHCITAGLHVSQQLQSC